MYESGLCLIWLGGGCTAIRPHPIKPSVCLRRLRIRIVNHAIQGRRGQSILLLFLFYLHPGFVEIAPLLKEERHACFVALVAEIGGPRLFHPTVRPTLAASHRPANALKAPELYRPQQRFEAQPANGRSRGPQVPVALVVWLLILGRSAQPYMTRRLPVTVILLREFRHAIRALREHLELMPGRHLHYLKHGDDKLLRDFGMKQVAHG